MSLIDVYIITCFYIYIDIRSLCGNYGFMMYRVLLLLGLENKEYKKKEQYIGVLEWRMYNDMTILLREGR